MDIIPNVSLNCVYDAHIRLQSKESEEHEERQPQPLELAGTSHARDFESAEVANPVVSWVRWCLIHKQAVRAAFFGEQVPLFTIHYKVSAFIVGALAEGREFVNR
jgi:hypothetical protein